MSRDHIETSKVHNKFTSHCLWQEKKCYIFTKLFYFLLLGTQEDHISWPSLYLGEGMRYFLVNRI